MVGSEFNFEFVHPQVSPEARNASSVTSTNQPRSGNAPETDFKEDPFQNYRYEDPFLIADPFQDDEAVTAAAKGKISITSNKVRL